MSKPLSMDEFIERFDSLVASLSALKATVRDTEVTMTVAAHRELALYSILSELNDIGNGAPQTRSATQLRAELGAALAETKKAYNIL